MPVCVGCEKEKPLGEFAKLGFVKRGHHSWCKTCVSEYAKLGRQARREKQNKIWDE